MSLGMYKIKIKPLLKAIAYVTVCAGTCLLLIGCAGASKGDFCLLYQPVYTSDDDSEYTLKQIDMNNALWLEMCD